MNDLDLVDVEWEDAYYDSEWKTYEDWQTFIRENPDIHHTVGYMVYDSPERIGLVNNVDVQGANNVFVIPKGMVRCVRYLAITNLKDYVAL